MPTPCLIFTSSTLTATVSTLHSPHRIYSIHPHPRLTCLFIGLLACCIDWWIDWYPKSTTSCGLCWSWCWSIWSFFFCCGWCVYRHHIEMATTRRRTPKVSWIWLDLNLKWIGLNFLYYIWIIKSTQTRRHKIQVKWWLPLGKGWSFFGLVGPFLVVYDSTQLVWIWFDLIGLD